MGCRSKSIVRLRADAHSTFIGSRSACGFALFVTDGNLHQGGASARRLQSRCEMDDMDFIERVAALYE